MVREMVKCRFVPMCHERWGQRRRHGLASKDERTMHDPYQTQRQQRGHMEGDEDRVKQSQANQDKLRCGARGLIDCRAKDKWTCPNIMK